MKQLLTEPKYKTREARIIGDGLWQWLKQPCGECHIPPGTGCDICGAEAPARASGKRVMGGWCTHCGCGNDAADYAHAPLCQRTPQADGEVAK